MRWTCPKCGRKMDVSNDQLIALGGMIVCPKCGLQARQPLPKSGSQATAAARRKTSDERPASNRMKSATSSPTSDNGSRQDGPASPVTRPRPKKKSTKKKKNSKDGMSGWGCLLRSVIFTLVLFAAYVFFGLLLEAMQ